MYSSHQQYCYIWREYSTEVEYTLEVEISSFKYWVWHSIFPEALKPGLGTLIGQS